MENVLTVLTPTYNRGNLLQKIYASMQKQSAYNFSWLIVDDGSSEDIEKTVNSFAQDKFKIKYVKKENGGKHTALNFGVKMVDTPLLLILDSDDWLLENAIETVNEYYAKYALETSICGFSFLRAYSNGKVWGKRFKKDELKDTYLKVRILGKDYNSNKSEVFFTEIFKQYPFPEYPGEKFLGEDIVWLRMSKKYDMIHVNKMIVGGDYLEGGLTDQRRQNNIKSPIGAYERSKEFLTNKLPFFFKLKNIMQTLIYGKFAGKSYKQITSETNKKFLSFAMYLPSLITYKIWDKKYNKGGDE